jgi:hypothetical protein
MLLKARRLSGLLLVGSIAPILVGLQQKYRRYFHPVTGLVILHTSL